MIFDIIVVVVLLISALHAFWRGLIREVLTIFGAIGGVFTALAYGDDLRPFMDGWLGVGTGANATKLFDVVPMALVSTCLSYLLVFVLVFGVLSFISHLIAEQVRAIGLGAVDRTLGVVFGLVRGLLIIGIFYLPMHLLMDPKDKESWFKDSQTHIVVEHVAGWIETMIPNSIKPAGAEATTKGETGPTTREQLKDQGVLPKQDGSSSTGYTPDARQVLEHLIDQGIKTAPPSSQEAPSGNDGSAQ